MRKQLTGKIALVTGANSGIGKATALGLAQQGATLIMVCRDRARGEAAQHEIKTASGNDHVDLLLADLSSLTSIRELVTQFEQRYSQLHILINNAGVAMLKRRETVDGLEMTLAVNHLAPFLLTTLLLETIKKSAPARIVNVGSDAHETGFFDKDDLQSKKHYQFMRAYGQSKMALMFFSYKLADMLSGTGVTVNALHPGFVGTNIGVNNVGPLLGRVVKFIIARLGVSPEEGARTSLYLATSPEIVDVTGKYFVKCVPKQSHRLSYEKDLQEFAWNESVRLVNRG